MKILFAFENPLSSTEADAEVFISTATHLAPYTSKAWLHVPVTDDKSREIQDGLPGIKVVPAWAPATPPGLRHLCCGLTIMLRQAFWQADLIYTRNLWVASVALLFGRRIVFDHYRPWPDQIPPLQAWIFRMTSSRRFLAHICHSDYTRLRYVTLGSPAEKLYCIHNGFDPARFAAPIPKTEARQKLGFPQDKKIAVYTGRVNHKKGLGLVVAAAKRLPDMLFVLVGSAGEGPIEVLARDVPNVRIVGWQTAEQLSDYIYAADLLLIPPSLAPLTQFGSTVLPIKLFLYLGSGRPILAGNTPDVSEVLKHRKNAWLCTPDDLDEMVEGLIALTTDEACAASLAAQAQIDSAQLTWAARARRIAGVIANRLQNPVLTKGVWGPGQTRIWADESKRWLRHLITQKSVILPPEDISRYKTES